jgi:hypothetical protein
MLTYEISRILILMKQKKIVTRIVFASTMILMTTFLLVYFSNKSYINNSNSPSVKVSIQQNGDGSSCIVSSDYNGRIEHKISEWKLDYPVFHFECADINADGTDDILVGVIKKTKFDSICRKRIFIFKLFEGYVRPLWLGSRVSQPLEDFKVIHSKPMNIIRTIELEENGKYLIADYKWKGFGLTFVKYISRNVNLQQAIMIFNKQKLNYENI